MRKKGERHVKTGLRKGIKNDNKQELEKEREREFVIYSNVIVVKCHN